MIEQELQSLQKDISDIKQRNLKVETDKAWETSLTRIASIGVITYIIAIFVMKTIGVEKYFLNALIPTVGFLLSTQSLPAIKKRWIKKYLNKQKTSA